MVHRSPVCYVGRVILVSVVCVVLALVCAVAVWADPLPSQFGNLSPLPGGGYAVDSEGRLDGLGALQINIPVAYNPQAGYVVASGTAGGVAGHKSDFKNGTVILGGAIGGWPRVWVSAMAVKSDLVVANGQVSVLSESDSQPGVAVGVQGLFPRDEETRKWGYAVATKGFRIQNRKNLYATLGVRGGSKYIRWIGGLSYPVTDSFNFATEWDGYQFNNGLAWRPGGRGGNVTVFGGYNGQTGWQAGASIGYRFVP